MKQLLGDFSVREKNLWFELLLDLAVALYYWPKAFLLMRAGDAALAGKAMVSLIVSTVFAAIMFSIVLSVLLHAQQKPEPMDERDLAIAARGKVWAGRVLVFGILAIIAQIVLQEMAVPFVSVRNPFQLTPLIIAHLLLVALMLASFTSSLTRLFCYRRGY